MLTKYATFEDAEVLEVKGSPKRQVTASLDKLSDFHDYRTDDGYMYVRLRAISSRVNKNHDGWPSIELAGGPDIFEHHAKQSSTGFTVEASDGSSERGFATFLGKPNFVDHNNSDPRRARGVVVDAKLKVLPLERVAASGDDYWTSDTRDPEHLPPTEVELLLEIDAKSFPKYAKAIRNGDLDGFSMGCFLAGTPITMGDGTKKPIEEIEVGDEVLTHRGNVHPVTYTMERGYKGTIYHVEVYGQKTKMKVTEEHPIWTKRGWVFADDLTVGDHVLTPRFKATVQEAVVPWAKLMGYYLAEGNLGYDRNRYPDGRPVSVEWNFHEDEGEYVEEVAQAIRECGYTPAGPYVKHHCATIRCNSPEFASSFLASAGQHSWEKKLAPHVLDWGIESQRALLDCYLNGDGHFRLGKFEVSTASLDLANQLQAIATRVGYRATPPTKQHSPSARYKRPKYSMYITPDERNDKRFYLDEEGLWRKVTAITAHEHNGSVYNFDVDGDDSYVAADVAVHNCDVEYSKCSHCGHTATNPDEYCSHIIMKGASHDFKTADGHRISRKSYENCYGIHFFEISGVFDPADETALAREIRAGVSNEGLERTADVHTAEAPLPQSFDTAAPEEVDTLRQERNCPICGENMEGETCDVCGYVEPPKGFDNPDLTKARELQDAMGESSQQQVNEDTELMNPQPGADQQGGEPPAQQGGQEQGHFMQARNSGASASVMSDMRWQPKLNPRIAARINQFEQPIAPSKKPASNEPQTVAVVKNPQKPVTSAMRTAQDMIEATKQNHQGDHMSTTRTADGPTGPEAAPDARVDTTGVGGVIEPSNEAASAADGTTEVMGVGSTGVTDVEADSTESLGAASQESDDSGFDKSKTTDDSGPTTTFGDSDGTEKGVSDPVTGESLEGNQNKSSGRKVGYDAKPFYDQPGLSGGSANKGTEPVDPVGKAQDRVDVLDAVATPENNSGPTSTWSGTDGNAIYRQQDPVTREVSDETKDGFTSHFVSSLKVAELEEELGLISREEKYERIPELEAQPDSVVEATYQTLSRVKVEGSRRLAHARQAGVTKLPGAFGRRTAAPQPDYRVEDQGFERVDLGIEPDEPVNVEDTLDAALFS